MVNMMKNVKEKKDYGYTGKHVFSDSYDVLVSNVFNKPQVVFFSDKLLKGFFDKDLQWNLKKFNLGYEIAAYMTQRSVIFTEKNAWKHRRTILQKVFNFDFITSQIPTMV